LVRTLRHAVALLAFTTLCAHAQTAIQPATQTITLRTPGSTQPLTASNLTLTIAGQPQTILKLEPHTANSPAPQPFTLPPGTFADATPLPEDATLNIVLLDALNTPLKSPAYLRSQLQQLTTHAGPSAPLAIFGLADHIILLQGFSSPRPLKDAVEHKLIPRASASPANDAASPSEALLAANLQQFLVQAASVDAQFHPQRTLDALNLLAHYLVGLPGHKNLFWLSASFPEGLFPNTTTPGAPSTLDAAQLYETHALLSAANVSIFPIDTHTLLPRSKSPHPAPSQATMNQIAESTGGQPFFDIADLAATVTSAMQAGSSYSTLTFTPTNPSAPNTSQPVSITASDPGFKLAYPHAIYAQPSKPAESYTAAVMARGAPTPSDVLFKVRVLPTGAPPEPAVAPGNTQNPDYRVLGPFQRYAVDFVAPGNQFSVMPPPAETPTGKYTARIEFFAYVYDINGRLLNTEGKAVALNLTSAESQKLQTTPLSLHLEVSVPTRQESYLRIAIRDTTANRFGVIELPASSVSTLPPAPVPSGPSR
jgi:VWFA-related protein